MKRYLFCFLMLFVSLTSFSQVGINHNAGISIGYSHIYDTKIVNQLMPRDLVSVDMNVCGVYLGFAYGERTLYSDCSYYECYSENLNTYIFRAGPSFRIGGYNVALSLTPYIGLYMNSYSEDIDEYNYYYYNYCYCANCTYTTSTSYCLYEHPFNYEFIYGLKAALNINMFEIGAHYSNKEIGVTVGITLNLY